MLTFPRLKRLRFIAAIATLWAFGCESGREKPIMNVGCEAIR